MHDSHFRLLRLSPLEGEISQNWDVWAREKEEEKILGKIWLNQATFFIAWLLFGFFFQLEFRAICGAVKVATCYFYDISKRRPLSFTIWSDFIDSGFNIYLFQTVVQHLQL